MKVLFDYLTLKILSYMIVLEDVQILRSKVVSQNNIIKSYKSWVNILLGMVNTNGTSNNINVDFATTIEKVRIRI